MKIEYTKQTHGKWWFQAGWVILLIGLLGTIVAFPTQGRLLYTRSEDSQAPNFEEVDSSQIAPPAQAAAAHDHATHPHPPIGHIPDRGRFTNSNESEAWPPQYRGASDVQWHENGGEGAVGSALSGRELATNDAIESAKQNADVDALLGTRFTFISASPIETKWEDEITGHTITWFSYSNNVTVEVVVEDDQVVEVRELAASDYQPPLRQNEVADAIAIARQYWIDQGQNHVDALVGYTIQTLQTEGEGGYYDTRMTYVSFHADPSSEPELMAWIDLTNQMVVRAVVDTAVTDIQLVPVETGVTQ